VRPYIADAAVYVVPLRIGGGTRLKIFEAMAMGKAVVSTTVGAEGLPIGNGEHLLLADDPPGFARGVVSLLRDVGRRRQLESAARALVVEKYDWSAVAGGLEEVLIAAAGGAASREASDHTRVIRQCAPQNATLGASLLLTPPRAERRAATAAWGWGPTRK